MRTLYRQGLNKASALIINESGNPPSCLVPSRNKKYFAIRQNNYCVTNDGYLIALESNLMTYSKPQEQFHLFSIKPAG